MTNRDELVGHIYDCAVDPTLWPKTLVKIRDAFHAAYALTSFVDIWALQNGLPTDWIQHNSPWEETWFKRLAGIINTVPGQDRFLAMDADESWTQSSQASEAELLKTDFFQQWVLPQNLKDCLNVQYVKRQRSFGVFSIARSDQCENFDAKDRALAESITPHIRRAMLINDIVDKSKLAQQLQRKTLDLISVPIYILDGAGKLIFANVKGNDFLAEGQFLGFKDGRIFAKHPRATGAALENAISLAAKSDVEIGIHGIGIPLYDAQGEMNAAYVLPLMGENLRGELGRQNSALFIANRPEEQPAMLEILRTVFDLTQAEARVSQKIADCKNPAQIAESLGVSINTVRTHLGHAFGKTNTSDQTSLGAMVNKIAVPLDLTTIKS